MALNFPTDTSQPYIDPVSGLKYVFNGEVGGWETAIQPPCIISTTPPTTKIPGFLWWDSVDGTLYVYYKDVSSEQWVEATPSALSLSTSASGTAPFNAVNGDIWYNTIEKRLYIRNESEWVDVIQSTIDFNKKASDRPNVFFSHTEPIGAVRGDIWYNRNENRGYIYSDESDFLGWQPFDKLVSAATQTVTTEAVEVPQATNEIQGTVRFATQSEVNSGEGTRTVISPGALKEAIQNYVSTLEVATSLEVAAGLDNSKVVTPATLRSVMDFVPIGTVITHALDDEIDGYVKCDGRRISRSTYSDLFSVIGTTFGAGDGISQFNVPNVSSTPLYSFIKF